MQFWCMFQNEAHQRFIQILSIWVGVFCIFLGPAGLLTPKNPTWNDPVPTRLVHGPARLGWWFRNSASRQDLEVGTPWVWLMAGSPTTNHPWKERNPWSEPCTSREFCEPAVHLQGCSLSHDFPEIYTSFRWFSRQISETSTTYVDRQIFFWGGNTLRVCWSHPPKKNLRTGWLFFNRIPDFFNQKWWSKGAIYILVSIYYIYIWLVVELTHLQKVKLDHHPSGKKNLWVATTDLEDGLPVQI